MQDYIQMQKKKKIVLGLFLKVVQNFLLRLGVTESFDRPFNGSHR